MTKTLLWRRASRSSRLHRTAPSPREGILVVEHEFEGGPFAGRRMTGLASGSDMHVVLPDRGRRWRLAAHATPRGCLGTYRFERAYDCTRTLERVHVYRWRPSSARDERRVSDAPR